MCASREREAVRIKHQLHKVALFLSSALSLTEMQCVAHQGSATGWPSLGLPLQSYLKVMACNLWSTEKLPKINPTHFPPAALSQTWPFPISPYSNFPTDDYNSLS